jgi:peptidoglycan/xylan/chitin deacetylase (PgdA/CDA1 family)
MLGVGGLAAGGVVAGHLTTALPSQAAESTSREDGAFAPTATGSQQILWSVTTTAPAVALTFDDGPNSAFTPGVLAALAAVGARATFFVIGEQVEREPALVRALLAGGHELGNHTGHHHSAALIDATATREDIDRGADAIERATGRPVRWYRPPRGMLTGSALEHAHRRGQGVAMWSVDRGPAADTDVASVRDHLIAGLQPGAVIDLHDGVGASSNRPITGWPAALVRRREAELQALPAVLEAGVARGIRFVTLSDLVALSGG